MQAYIYMQTNKRIKDDKKIFGNICSQWIQE